MSKKKRSERNFYPDAAKTQKANRKHMQNVQREHVAWTEIIPVGGTDRTSREENRFKAGIENYTTKQSGVIWKERTKEYERLNKKAPVEIKRLEDL